jgi:uncharacterized protein YdaU (DUF1376 family)
MKRPWMPLYVGDYLADTKHLTTVEHGAYVLLMMHYWQHSGLPDDDARLARIAGLNAEEWAGVKKTLAELFEPGWTHKRIDAELAKAAQKSRNGRRGGLVSGARRRILTKQTRSKDATENINSNKHLANCGEANAKQTAKQTRSKQPTEREAPQPQPQSHSEYDSQSLLHVWSVADATRPCAQDEFEEFWRCYPKRDGPNPKAPARRKFEALVKSGVDPAAIIASARRCAEDHARRGEVNSRYIAQAVTWLNQRRFEDYAASGNPRDSPAASRRHNSFIELAEELRRAKHDEACDDDEQFGLKFVSDSGAR